MFFANEMCLSELYNVFEGGMTLLPFFFIYVLLLLRLLTIFWVIAYRIIFIFSHLDLLQLLRSGWWLLHFLEYLSFDSFMFSLSFPPKNLWDIFVGVKLLLLIVIAECFFTDETFCDFCLANFELFSASSAFMLFAYHICIFKMVFQEKVTAGFHSTFLHIFSYPTTLLGGLTSVNSYFTIVALCDFNFILALEIVSHIRV